MIELSQIELMRQLGFTDYEAKCYLALFKKDSLTVSETATLADIPRPNTYEALGKLLSKGLCVALPGKNRRYAAADPRFLRERSLEALSNSMKAVDSFANELDLLYTQCQNNNNSLNYLEMLKEPAQIHQKQIQLCATAKFEILGFSKPPFASSSEKLRHEQTEILKKAVKKGVILKSIHELPGDSKERIKMFKDLRELYDPRHEEIRLIKKLPMKTTIIDKKKVLFSLENPVMGEKMLTAIVVEHAAFAESQLKMFEAYWKEAHDYYVIDGAKHFLSKESRIKNGKA